MATITSIPWGVTGLCDDNAITVNTLAALLNATISQTSSTQYVLTHVSEWPAGAISGVDYDTLVFGGTGFTYTDGVPTSGTINSVTQRITGLPGDNTGMVWSGLNVSWATFWSTMSAAQTTGNLTPLNNLFFGGNDTFTISYMKANFSGFDGDDVFNYGRLFDSTVTVDGGSGTDTLNLDGTYGSFSGQTMNFPQTLLSTSLKSIEKITMTGAHNYAFQWFNGADPNTSGSAVTIDASTVTSAGYLFFDGSRERTIHFTIIGSAGNDTLTGGSATNDGVKYSGNSSAYTITQNANGSCTVAGPDGTDTLTNIEFLVFNDGTQSLTGAVPPEPVSGTSGSDVLTAIIGRGGVFGLGGVDTLIGSAGNDTLDGGVDVDTAVVSGNRSSYTITQTNTGRFQITGPGGTDTLWAMEYLKFDDQTIRLLPGTGSRVNFANDPSTYMGAIRDFDGNDLGGAASWKLIGTADVNGDGRAEHILFNRQIGRWAEVATETDELTYFANSGWAGDTRVVGIYIDPLVANGTVVKDSDTDSQRRFQNDLFIDNIKAILGQGDYNHDGLQEIYFSLTDGTAYLHAYMHADGNIQYANYQNKQQVIDYLTSNGVASSTWSSWFPASQAAIETASSNALLAAGTTANGTLAAVAGG